MPKVNPKDDPQVGRKGSLKKKRAPKPYVIMSRTPPAWCEKLMTWRVVARFANEVDRDHELAKYQRWYPAVKGTQEFKAEDMEDEET